MRSPQANEALMHKRINMYGNNSESGGNASILSQPHPISTLNALFSMRSSRRLDNFSIQILTQNIFHRGWAEQKQRSLIPVPALPEQEFWQEKKRKICNSLNWF